ncbi:MAG: DUF1232 domain-containing protein [Thermodesulfobacteriota bacterium]
MALLPGWLRFVAAVFFLLLALVYTISPIDLIPDLFGPLGWVDDIALWVGVVALECALFFKDKKGTGPDKEPPDEPEQPAGGSPLS